MIRRGAPSSPADINRRPHEVCMSDQLTATATKKASVLLVEDHPIVLQGLCMLIDGQTDLAVCGSTESVQQALPLVKKLRPDVVVVDISLGDGSGLELIKQLHEAMPSLAILTLSMHDENLFAERAMRAGARGYLMKKE